MNINIEFEDEEISTEEISPRTNYGTGLNMPSECIPCSVCGIAPEWMEMACRRADCPN